MDIQEKTNLLVKRDEEETDVKEKEESSAQKTKKSSQGTIPEGVPAKFWDEEKQEIRVQSLLKSYLELEQLHSRKKSPMPKSSEEYTIKIEHDFLEVDPQINELLYQAGFTNDQAQLVYDLAVERLLPVAQAVYEQMEDVMVEERLSAHFGGKEKWEEIRSQLSMWAKRHLPENALQALSGSHEGILLIHRMMSDESEKTLLREGRKEEGLNEKELHQLIRDPRYWRDGDTEIINRVRKGFQRLYPE